MAGLEFRNYFPVMSRFTIAIPLRIIGGARKFNEECGQHHTLKPDATDWRNAGMAEFYHKKAIHLTE